MDQAGRGESPACSTPKARSATFPERSTISAATSAARPRCWTGCRRIDPSSLPEVSTETRVSGPCVGGVGKFVAIGLNYYDHARETGMEPPRRAGGVHQAHQLHRRAERRRGAAARVGQGRLGGGARLRGRQATPSIYRGGRRVRPYRRLLRDQRRLGAGVPDRARPASGSRASPATPSARPDRGW